MEVNEVTAPCAARQSRLMSAATQGEGEEQTAHFYNLNAGEAWGKRLLGNRTCGAPDCPPFLIFNSGAVPLSFFGKDEFKFNTSNRISTPCNPFSIT